MLTKFKVENFKSIHSLELELGRVNVFIGENGSGKSNVLEAVAVTSAVNEGKFSNEILVPQGVRMPEHSLLTSAFDRESKVEPIRLKATVDGEDFPELLLILDSSKYGSGISELAQPVDNSGTERLKKYLELFPDESILREVLRKSIMEKPVEERNKQVGILYQFDQFLLSLKRIEQFQNFIIFAPENTALRNFAIEGQVQPLGIHGEGLFRELQRFASQADQPAIRELNERLQLFGWFDSFALPERLWPGESFLKIKDRYLDANIEFIDQRSANEGFLFVLFYLSLFISKDTPKFFAIDNIENSLNPKMCTKLMTTVAELAKAHDKQVMITTHSPAILDGIDLNDDEQRLFLVYRNKLGHTVAKRVSKPQPLPGQIPAKLSELFMMGHLGGLPKNFSI